MSRASRAKRVLAPAAPLALALVAALPAGAGVAAPPRGRMAGSVLKSRQLWATINVCSPADQPDLVGVRGSMPSDGRAHDGMFMSFRLQYLNGTTKRWTDLAATTKPHFVSVGSGAARQGGQSFQLMPVSGKPAFTLRGMVEFQWRRGKKLLTSTSRPTAAGHHSLAGADPPGYSAATCLIG